MSAKYDSKSRGITPQTSSAGAYGTNLALQNLDAAIGRELIGCDVLKKGIADGSIEVLVMGGTTPEDIAQIISRFSNITALHIVDCDEKIFTDIDDWIGSDACRLKNMPKIYGYRVNAMELPRELEDRVSLLIDTSLIDHSHMSRAQIERIGLEAERVLKVGGLRISTTPTWYSHYHEFTYDTASRMKPVYSDEYGKVVRIWAKTNASVPAQAGLILESVKTRAEDILKEFNQRHRDSANIVIAIERDCFALDRPNVKSDMDAMVGAIRHMVHRLRTQYKIAENVEIVYGSKDDILEGVNRAHLAGVPYSNMVFIGQKRILEISEFAEARKGRAVFACLNPTDVQGGLFQIPEMAAIALDLAFGRLGLSEIQKLHPHIYIKPDDAAREAGEIVFILKPILSYDISNFDTEYRHLVEKIANQA